jgi:hypothetical protein
MTNPRKLTSPVIDVSDRTSVPVRSDTNAVVIATPADGPGVVRIKHSFITMPAQIMQHTVFRDCSCWKMNMNILSTIFVRQIRLESLRKYIQLAAWFKKTNTADMPSTSPIKSALALIQLWAIFADSFITSPRLPVMTTDPEPFIFEASMKSNSPPACVHAIPVATPGAETRRADSCSNFSVFRSPL